MQRFKLKPRSHPNSGMMAPIISSNFLPLFFLPLLLLPLASPINPISPTFYADPEASIFNSLYHIHPTYSAPYDQQTFFDAFTSPDLVNWTKYERILTMADVSWARRAMWAPSVVQNGDKYYLFFGANDVHEGEVGGIGVAVGDTPTGPFRDHLGAPLIQDIVNGAQPIDQFVYRDPTTWNWYMFYGGWGHCNVVRLNSNFTALLPFGDGTYYKEITPPGYVEGPFMLKRNGTYYFMWSEGGWTGPDYKVAYGRGSSPTGPFVKEGIILEQDPEIATGAGHHSVFQVPGESTYFIAYHRRPLNETDANARVTCVDEMKFDADGRIEKVQMTFEGVVGPNLP